MSLLRNVFMMWAKVRQTCGNTYICGQRVREMLELERMLEGKRRAAYYTVGCKLNFAETLAIGKAFGERGVRRVRRGEQADICVVNTCAVTESAEKKSRQAIRRIGRLHPGAKVVVTGCYAQLKPAEVGGITGVDELLRRDGSMFAPSCLSDVRTRHFMKVQDGCDYGCTYCTIPTARGVSRNGSIASLVSQAGEVAAAGGQEIVLTGVNIGDFGKSTGERLIDLLRALDAVEGIARYRLSSIEPNLLTDAVIAFVAGSRRFAPHFHLPLQSGSDSVLRLMGRKYDTALFRRKVETIRAMLPHAFIGADIIAGMRGETDALFAEGRAFVAGLDVSKLHVFAYSERPGTPALRIPYAVDAQTKHLRSRALLKLSEAKQQAFYERQVGQEADVLFEQSGKDGRMQGFTANYIRTEAPYQAALINTVCRVRLTGWNAARTALTCRLPDDAD